MVCGFCVSFTFQNSCKCEISGIILHYQKHQSMIERVILSIAFLSCAAIYIYVGVHENSVGMALMAAPFVALTIVSNIILKRNNKIK